MWLPATRQMTFVGSANITIGSASPPLPLKGVTVDVYRMRLDGTGEPEFELLSQVATKTDDTGVFEFSDVPVMVTVQTAIPGSPPYLPVELVRPDSLPNLVFRISAEAEVLGLTSPEGTQFVTLYDEREVVDSDWISSHPERMRVPLAGSPPIEILIPEEATYYDEAMILAGIPWTAPSVPGQEFHFLRIGRTIRQELGEFADPRSEFTAKPGYMNSSNTWTVTPPEPSFFPGRIDAPFGRSLHIGGHFGADFLTPPLVDNLYYAISFSEYSGAPADPYDPTQLINTVRITDPLFNKRYTLPTPALPKGKWETLHLGPFEGEITAVEDPAEAALIGTVDRIFYERPGLPDFATEYWPFWDLMLIWNSAAAPNELIVLTVEVYEKLPGPPGSLNLRKRIVTPSVNDHLPLRIDNRRPVPKYHPYDPADPLERKFHTANADFIGVPALVGPTTPMDICNEFNSNTPQPNGNVAILVRYSVEDGAGNPHPHLNSNGFGAEYTPRAIPGAPDSKGILLKPTFSGFDPIRQVYSRTTPPIMTAENLRSVIVPSNVEGWPPEPNGDLPPQCPQYALEVSLECSVRTVDGWSRIFGHPHVSRHLIVKK